MTILVRLDKPAYISYRSIRLVAGAVRVLCGGRVQQKHYAACRANEEIETVMTRIIVEAEPEGEGLTAVHSVFRAIHSLCPAIAKAIEAAQHSLYRDGTLPRRLRELIRLRIGFHNQCRTCMAVRYAPDSVSESLVCSLERPADSPELTEAEQAALAFADLFATNHLAIDDAVYQRLRRHFAEGQIVELGFICAIFLGTGRLAATWQVTEVLPESFRAAEGVVAPWGHDTVLSPQPERRPASAE